MGAEDNFQKEFFSQRTNLALLIDAIAATCQGRAKRANGKPLHVAKERLQKAKGWYGRKKLESRFHYIPCINS